MRKKKIFSRWLAVAFSAMPMLASAAPAVTEHLSIDLVAETTAIHPGQDLWLGLHIQHQPHWHTYWINPGDSGLAIKLAWHLPPGFEAGEIQWPAPQRFIVDGLNNFGYDGDLLLPVQVHVAANAKSGEVVHFGVDAKWLVCSEECVPGKANLNIDLAVAPTTPAIDTATATLFRDAREAQPQTMPWTGKSTLDGENIDITVHDTNLLDAKSVDAFVVQREVVGYSRPEIHRNGGDLILRLAKSDYFSTPPTNLDLVLVTAPQRAWQMRIPFAATHP